MRGRGSVVLQAIGIAGGLLLAGAAGAAGRLDRMDTDQDGVADVADRCAGTPVGAAVDAQGCSLPDDNDGDGIRNDLDDCPTTPKGLKVDKRGCGYDTDRDGVADGRDLCPEQGGDVDRYGCPKSGARPVLPAPAAAVAPPPAPSVAQPAPAPAPPPRVEAKPAAAPAPAPAPAAPPAAAPVAPTPPAVVGKPRSPESAIRVVPAPALEEPEEPAVRAAEPAVAPAPLPVAPAPTAPAPQEVVFTLQYQPASLLVSVKQVNELEAQLPALKQRLKAPGARLIVRGESEASEGTAGNQLSVARANQVRRWLISKGVDRSRIVPVALPVVATREDEPVGIHRRVELVFALEP